MLTVGGWITGADPGGIMGGRWSPFQGWISCTSLLCLAKKPALPSLMNLDLTQNVANNLFVQWESQVPLTSRAVCLLCGNDVGVVFTKTGVAKVFVRTLHVIIYYLTPQLDILDHVRSVCACVCVCVCERRMIVTLILSTVPELRLHFIPTDSVQLTLYGRPLAFTYSISTYRVQPTPSSWLANKHLCLTNLYTGLGHTLGNSTVSWPFLLVPDFLLSLVLSLHSLVRDLLTER